jgi:hypothetical protein
MRAAFQGIGIPKFLKGDAQEDTTGGTGALAMYAISKENDHHKKESHSRPSFFCGTEVP